MANISGRRAPNMSQYIADLNRPSAQASEPTGNFDDLNLFATTDFFDFDMGDNLQASADFEQPQETKAIISTETSTSSWDDQSSTDFMTSKFSPLVIHLALHFRSTLFATSFPASSELLSQDVSMPLPLTPGTLSFIHRLEPFPSSAALAVRCLQTTLLSGVG